MQRQKASEQKKNPKSKSKQRQSLHQERSGRRCAHAGFYVTPNPGASICPLTAQSTPKPDPPLSPSVPGDIPGPIWDPWLNRPRFGIRLYHGLL